MRIEMRIRLDLHNIEDIEAGKTPSEMARKYIENDLDMIERQVQYLENGMEAPCVYMRNETGDKIGNITTKILGK